MFQSQTGILFTNDVQIQLQLIEMDKQIDKNLQLPTANPLYSDVSWIAKKVDYSKMQYPQLQSENQKILATLKIIESKLSVQLQQKKKLGGSKAPQTQNVKALDEKIKNNEKLIAALKKDSQTADQRKGIINQGLQSKTIETKFNLERSINKLKSEIKMLKLEEHETVKRLQQQNDPLRPEHHEQHARMQQQLRVMSIKYVRLLDKYNKSTQKLALATKIQIPQLQIPQDIYDKQLEQRQQTQFKQYQGIVKLCTVLSHRNDSEHNKAHRQYTIKLKQLERTIMKLGELDQAITAREGQLIESKKNIQLCKVRMSNDESVDSRAMRLSQGSIPSIGRMKSNSTAKLHNLTQIEKINNNKQDKLVQMKLRNRGYSLSRIKAA